MSWSITGINYRGVIEPSSSTVTLSGTGDEVFVAFLGSHDGRDNRWQVCTFNGQNMSSINAYTYVRKDNTDDTATLAGYYYDCKALPAGNYTFTRECTTGGPDGGMEMWFVIHRDRTTSPTTITTIYGTSVAYGVYSPAGNIAVSYTNSLVVAAYYSQMGGTFTTGSGQTNIVTNYDNGSDNLFGASYKVSNAGTSVMSWGTGGSNDEWVEIIFVVSPVFTPTISKSESIKVSESTNFVIDRLLTVSDEVTLTETLKMLKESNIDVSDTSTVSEYTDTTIRDGLQISIWKDTVTVTDLPDFPGPRDFHPLDITPVSEDVTVKIVNDVNEGSKPTFKVEY